LDGRRRGREVSAALIAFVGLVYAYISAEQFIWGSPWLGVVFGGYALSNVGLWQLAR
jgi:EamA domain-containing membrane protein RarD